MLRFANFSRNRQIGPHASARVARNVLAKAEQKVQFNIRVDRGVLDRFRDYCRRNGLDPQGQIVLFMRKVLDTEFDFQARLWSALKEEAP